MGGAGRECRCEPDRPMIGSVDKAGRAAAAPVEVGHHERDAAAENSEVFRVWGPERKLAASLSWDVQNVEDGNTQL